MSLPRTVQYPRQSPSAARTRPAPDVATSRVAVPELPITPPSAKTCAQIVSYASQIFTLEPDDVISAGTLGLPEEKQVWLEAGDKVARSAEGLGELRFELT